MGLYQILLDNCNNSYKKAYICRINSALCLSEALQKLMSCDFGKAQGKSIIEGTRLEVYIPCETELVSLS